ncbi:EF-hand domain-containing protein [Thalassotalea profundi]|uniref:EF-hand domain-containing protein n=1 Tax=Thalassotalea profundi TaxID=2036687 RepID=A0ABQ3ISD7_9GAMM|nr:EF-hand domain-containing protein [Thalassotalea profundi]GHE91515.1 hypothetical protein GCM10011501_21120 [Thalassotalea profundi]
MFSLKKVTLVVVSSLVATLHVGATEPVKVTEEMPTIAKVDLTSLLSQFDNDNNGLLSKAEVAVSKNKILLDNFDEIDANNDGGLSENELASFDTES